LASLDLQLSPDQLNALNEASQIELGFPYDMYTKAMVAQSPTRLRDQILV